MKAWKQQTQVSSGLRVRSRLVAGVILSPKKDRCSDCRNYCNFYLPEKEDNELCHDTCNYTACYKSFI